MTKEEYYYWLQSLNFFSIGVRRKMLERTGSPEELFGFSGKDLFRLDLTPSLYQTELFDRSKNAEKIHKDFEELAKKNICFTDMESENYPERLFSLKDPPFGIFHKGRLPSKNVPTVGIVGARRCTNYGKDMAFFFGRELSKRGVQIISGMALGVDGFSQRGAVREKGGSFAVLGGGVDICYPRENIDLYEELTKKGGIISERLPGEKALPADFPIRNRIIAALSDVLIVIEAAEHSGSLITVNMALEQNKEVFALPGRVGDRMAAGCNELIKCGAEVLTCPEDVLQYLGLSVGEDTVKRANVTLSDAEKTVFGLLGKTPVSTEELLDISSLPLSVLTEILVKLEIKGVIKKESHGGYVRL